MEQQSGCRPHRASLVDDSSDVTPRLFIRPFSLPLRASLLAGLSRRGAGRQRVRLAKRRLFLDWSLVDRQLPGDLRNVNPVS
jgi:hypothetical protein